MLHTSVKGLALVERKALCLSLNIYTLIPLMIQTRKPSEPNDISVVKYSNPIESSASSHSHICGVMKVCFQDGAFGTISPST